MRKPYLGLFLTFGLVLFFCAVVAMTVHAQGSTDQPQEPLNMAKIGMIATVVASVLQGIKKFFPGLGGWYAVAINFILSLALAYATAPTSASHPQPSLNLVFFIHALSAAISAAGIHSFLRPAGVTSTGTPFASGKGS
jgi:hypothetical protein